MGRRLHTRCRVHNGQRVCDPGIDDDWTPSLAVFHRLSRKSASLLFNVFLLAMSCYHDAFSLDIPIGRTCRVDIIIIIPE